MIRKLYILEMDMKILNAIHVKKTLTKTSSQIPFQKIVISGKIIWNIAQCAGTDLNKRFLPKPMTTTGWKETPYSHLSNKHDVTHTNFRKFHPARNKNPPCTFIDFITKLSIFLQNLQYSYQPCLPSPSRL